MNEQTVPENSQSEPPTTHGPGARGVRRWLPRPETMVLLLALLWTLAAKMYIVQQQMSDAPLVPLYEAILPDVIFFTAVALLFMAMAFVEQRRVVPRLTLVLATMVLGWSVLNASWLITTSVQLQPGVLNVLLASSSDMGPMVSTYLGNNLLYAIPLGITVLLAGGWFIWRVVSPLPLDVSRGVIARNALLAVIVIALAGFAQHLNHRKGITAYSGQVLAFSSHWYALMNLTGERYDYADIDSEARQLPRVGERELTPPNVETEALPNVVVILLESVPHAFTSLPGSIGAKYPPVQPESDLTPQLAQLAAEGVDFQWTRVPMPQTTKAFWATFTGSMPEVRAGFIESILVDRPYESLASILRRVGYRSGFFQMSTGTFECLPGVFANQAFDWAWFFENLEDESAKISALTGDDFAMIPTMFDWVEQDDSPFLLTMITTVAHDPYRVPTWFKEQQSEERAERFLDTVRYTDAFVGEVLDQLQQRGLSDNTIVCVLGDHGEAFRPESRRGRWAPFEEVIRVPWVIRWPGHIEPGAKVTTPVSQIDVTPTILSLIGFDISQAGFHGKDALQEQDQNRRIYFSSWYISSPLGYVQNGQKYTYWPAIDTLFLYDLESDPYEQSPQVIEGQLKAQVIDDVRRWEAQSHFTVPARRFREDIVYNHWRMFSSGRTGRSYYIPSSDVVSSP